MSATARRRLLQTCAVVLVVALVRLATLPAGAPAQRVAARTATSAPPVTEIDPSTTQVPTDPTTAPPAPPTTAAPAPAAPAPTAPPTTKAPAPKPKPSTAAGRPAGPKVAPVRGFGAFRGLGAWVDVYDWTATYTNGNPTVGPDDVDRMAAAGVQALYIQTARSDSPDDVLEPDRLAPIIARAKARHILVIGWYLPTLEDLDFDLRHLRAIGGLGVDGIGVDIESTKVSDIGERNRRLVQLSASLRQALPAVPLAAVVLPAVVLEVINPNYWPDFPYRDIAGFYDSWMPMSYWTNRTTASGYRDAYRYTSENITRLRNDVGRADLPVHALGGIGDQTTVADDDGFVRACAEQHCIGGGLYDWHSASADEWTHLQPLRF